MKSRQFSVKTIFTAVALLPMLLHAQDSVFDRAIAMAYADTHEKTIDRTDKDLLEQLDRVNPPVTALVPFLLNVEEPDEYAQILGNLSARNIVIYPGIGDASKNPINSQVYKKIARKYRKYTDRIELENMQQYSTMQGGVKKIADMIEFLNVTLGFKHIQLNAWPRQPNQTVYPFSNPAVDSTIIQVLLDFNRMTYKVRPNQTNWLPDQPNIDGVLAYNSTINVFVNYENKPQEAALANQSTTVQIAAFNTTINAITDLNKQANGKVHWIPPFSVNYDPIKEGTWDFIIQELDSM